MTTDRFKAFWDRIGDRKQWPRSWWYPEPTQRAYAIPEEWRRQHDETSRTVRRTMLAVVAYSFFCLLTLGAPDASLISADSTVKVPFANIEIGFGSFLIVGPIILLALSSYLHIFVGYWHFLKPTHDPGLPFLFNLNQRFAQWFSACIFYWLPPGVLAVFAWKSSPRAEGIPLAVATCLLAGAMLLLRVRRRVYYSPAVPRVVLRLAAAGALAGILLTLGGVWMGTNPFTRQLNLVGADLSGKDLEGLDLAGTDLSRADLSNANLRSTLLYDANLSGADLEGADLRRAGLGKNVARLVFGEAGHARSTHWIDVRQDGRLNTDDLPPALEPLLSFLAGYPPFGKAQLAMDSPQDYSYDLKPYSRRGAQPVNLVRARLRGAILVETNLRGVNLNDADLAGAKLGDVILMDAVLRRADLSRAEMRRANLRNADLGGAKLVQTDLREADLSGVKLVPMMVLFGEAGTDLSGANLCGVTGLDLEEVQKVSTDQHTLLPGDPRCQAASEKESN